VGDVDRGGRTYWNGKTIGKQYLTLFVTGRDIAIQQA
jgi:hypothetical protein